MRVGGSVAAGACFGGFWKKNDALATVTARKMPQKNAM